MVAVAAALFAAIELVAVCLAVKSVAVAELVAAAELSMAVVEFVWYLGVYLKAKYLKIFFARENLLAKEFPQHLPHFQNAQFDLPAIS